MKADAGALGAARALYVAAIRLNTAAAWERAAVAYEAYAHLLRGGLAVRHHDLAHVQALIGHARRRGAECHAVSRMS